MGSGPPSSGLESWTRPARDQHGRFFSPVVGKTLRTGTVRAGRIRAKIALGIVAALAILWLTTTAAAEEIRFDHLGADDGLSQISGNAVVQDRHGFLWIGTQDGLNRYDGYDIVVYKSDPTDPDSLWDNFITGLWLDGRGDLWITTNAAGAINRLTLETGRIERFTLQTQALGAPAAAPINPRALFEDERGRLWIGTTGSGLFLLDPSSGQVEHLFARPADESALTSNGISSFLLDRNGELWVGTFGGGLHRRLPATEDKRTDAGDQAQDGAGLDAERFERFRNDPEDPGSLANNIITHLYEDSRGELWVATFGAGLGRLDREKGRFEPFRAPNLLVNDQIPAIQAPIFEDRHGRLLVITMGGVSRLSPDRRSSQAFIPDPNDPLPTGPPLSAFLDSAEDLWIGTNGGGLYRLPKGAENWRHLVRDAADPTSLSSNFVAAIFEDSSGLLWFGTNNGGLSSYSRHKHRFQQIRTVATDADGLRDNKVFSVLADSEGRLWAGTVEGGAHRFDADRRRVDRHYGLLPGTPFDIGANGVRAIVEDSRGDIWIGTLGGGLSKIDASGIVTARYVNDPNDNTSLANNFIQGVFEDRRGLLWISTGFGLDIMDRDRKTFEHLRPIPQDPTSLPSTFVRFVEESPRGFFWVGTGSGLARLDPETRTFSTIRRDESRPESLASDNVMAVYEEDEHVWVATYGGGLDHCDIELTSCSHFTSRDGLPTDSIYSVLPDREGDLWISSNRGLSRFDPATRTLTNYEAADGLGGDEFNGRAFDVASDGEMIFGGMHGLTTFYPENARSSAYRPPIVLTAFRRFEEEQVFDRSLQELDAIELSYRDDFFSFNFAAIDFTNPEKNRYAYQLVGFDKDWIEAGKRRYASYTNLDGGDYLFRVKGTNVDGVWSEAKEIRVRVIPPPWKTWWAYGLYVLLTVAGILGYVRYRTLAHEEELRTAREEAESQRLFASRLQQIDRMKDTFLANTSHELRTPLNGIIGIAESLRDGATGDLPEPTRSNLRMIASSGRRLSSLVDDILDFSKLKSHELELRRRAVGLREVVDLVMSLSKPLVGDKELELENRIPVDLPLVSGDENRLQQVMHNLIGNSIKFTSEGTVAVDGRVTHHAEEGVEKVEITVSDTGIGIPAEKLQSIFESFEQADASTAREFGGTGLGLTITRQLIDLHGGAIRVESEPGVGSSFIFTLPMAGHDEAPSTDPEPSRARDTARSATSIPARLAALDSVPRPGDAAKDTSAELTKGRGDRHLEGVKVLSVDDDPVNLQVLHNILSLEGCDLTEASDGETALALIEKGYRPDLLLLDVMMPRLTGFEVCRRLRRRFSGNQLPIILLTAKNQMSDLVQGLASGANDYLTKPFSKIELLARIDTHLSLSKAHSAEADNRRKAEELEQARAIQLSLLPQSPPELPFLDIAVHMTTATEVGGDYYDFFVQPDGSLYAVTGDATGHGISAGMMVAMIKSTLKALDVQSPHILLRQVGRVIRSVNPEHMNMALNVVHIEPDEFSISSAAMPPAFLYRSESKQVEEILVSGLPLGTRLDPEYSLRLESLRSGDTLVLISDGLPELLDGDDEPLGYAAVERAIADHGHRPVKELLRALVELGSSWSQGHADDDITVVVVKRQ